MAQEMRKRFKPLSYGKDRITFAHKGFVIKIPRDMDGYIANRTEYELYRKHGKKKGYARCRMWGDALVMERVACARGLTRVIDYDPQPVYDLPKWTRKIDNQQVGYDSKGRLVAYDYGG